MNRLSTLGGLVIGTLVLATVFAISYSDQPVSADFDNDGTEGGRHVVSGDRGEFSIKNDDLELMARWRGNYELTEAGDGIKALDHKLEIEKSALGIKQVVIFKEDRNEVKTSYAVDGEDRDEGRETDDAVQSLLVQFLRASGAKAEERTRLILNSGGIESVLAEIDALEIDHARRRYAAVLTAQEDLNPDQLRTLLASIKSIKSDSDLRSALNAVLENENISADEVPDFLDAAATIESDYDLRRLIETVAERGLNETALITAIKLTEAIESDHDLRRASETLLKAKSLSPEHAAQILSVIEGQLESDHDLQLILTQAAPFLTQGQGVGDAWLGVFDKLNSSHDQRRALESAAETDNLSISMISTLIEKTHAIESDHDRRLVLEQFAKDVADNPELLTVYRSAVAGIQSDTDRRLALEAGGLE